MKVFIINLERSLDRRHSIAAQCNKLGLDYEFIAAVDGRTLSEKEIEESTHALNYAFKTGEIGCALSHLNIYKKMVSENITEALILEDDALLSADVKSVVSSTAMKHISKYPSVLLLSKVNKLINRKIFNINDKLAVYRVQHATTAHAYMLNLEAAKNLVNLLFPVWMVADKWSLFEDFSAIKVFAVYPEPVVLTELAQESTIIVETIDTAITERKQKIWRELMSRRPLQAKVKHRLRRIFTPLFNEIINVKELRKKEG